MIPNSLTKGDAMSLRKDVLPHGKVRKWIFMGKNQGRVILVIYRPKGGHILEVVKEDEIDWEEYSLQISGKTSSPGIAVDSRLTSQNGSSVPLVRGDPFDPEEAVFFPESAVEEETE